MDPNQPIQTTESSPQNTPEENPAEIVNSVSKSSLKNKRVVLVLVLLILGLLSLLVYLFYQNTQLKQQVELVELDKPTVVTCEYNGQTYEAGEGFTASDGCNSCSCSETGEVACTLTACGEETQPSGLNDSKVSEDVTGKSLDQIKYVLPKGWSASISNDNQLGIRMLNFTPSTGGYLGISVYNYADGAGRRDFYCKISNHCIPNTTYFEEVEIGNISGYIALAIDNSGGGAEYFGVKGDKFYYLQSFRPGPPNDLDKEFQSVLDSLEF